MTQTVPAESRAEQSPAGLTIDRTFTTPGVHPYEEVTWTRRDVVQQNWRTGETIFTQRGGEFPDFWSENAATIVTTKYFRGALGSETREHSLKQLIDGVVDRYTRAGREHGYFAGEADAEVFSHELRSEEHTSELQSRFDLVCRLLLEKKKDRKSKRLTSSHVARSC